MNPHLLVRIPIRVIQRVLKSKDSEIRERLKHLIVIGSAVLVNQYAARPQRALDPLRVLLAEGFDMRHHDEIPELRAKIKLVVGRHCRRNFDTALAAVARAIRIPSSDGSNPVTRHPSSAR